MRSKFSELVKFGVASRHYDDIAPDTAGSCNICRAYNNLWGVLTDTHMSCFPDGRRIITGTLISNQEKWNNLLYYCTWGGVRFATSGWTSLSEFFYAFDLEPKLVELNGQPAIELIDCEDCDCPCDCVQCASYTTTESRIPQPIDKLGNVKECLKCGSLKGIIEALNRSDEVVGEHWHMSGNKIIGSAFGTTVIIEASFDTGEKCDWPELDELFAQEGLTGLYYRKFPRYYALDSDDKKWQKLLRNDPNNKLFIRDANRLSTEDWFDEAKAIIATYS